MSAWRPAGTIVDLPAGETSIEKIEVGQRVMSYAMSSLVLNARHGSRVVDHKTRPWTGELVTVRTVSTPTTSMSRRHPCVAKIGPAFHGRSVLYLMRQGGRWRVGVTSSYHGARKGNTGVQGRLREEGGDAVWVLDVFDDRADALAAEEATSLTYRIPQARFESRFWSRWDSTISDPASCLAEHGRDIAHPLITSDRRYLLYERATVVPACNLLDRMLMLDAYAFHERGGRGTCPEAWRPITTGRRTFRGFAHQLTVEGSNTFVADGLVTFSGPDSTIHTRQEVVA